MQQHHEWVLKIILSCLHPWHLECARKIVECFRDKYGEGPEWLSLMVNIDMMEGIIRFDGVDKKIIA